MVLPAAVRYQTELATNVGALKAAGVETDTAPPGGDLEHRSRDLRAALAHTVATPWPTHGARPRSSTPSTPRTSLLPAMAAVRSAADLLEALVADDLWPLPTYQEMLFIL